MKEKRRKEVVIIGGGTGTSVLIAGLRNYPVKLTAIVAVTDSGGSTGRLRTEFGFLPVGDMRQCLAALAYKNSQNYIQKLLLYRFAKGIGLKGHNLGNLILTALTEIAGSEQKALAIAANIFRLEGKILPVTTKKIELMATYNDGTEIVGEHLIDEPKHLGGKKIIKLTTKPQAQIFKGAKKAIFEADLVILGPGDLYTSILPNLIIKGMPQALQKTQAKIIYIVNLMTRYSQTAEFSAKDHIKEIETYAHLKLDYILVNQGKIPPKLLNLYKKEKGFPVKDDLLGNRYQKIIRKNFVDKTIYQKPKGDKLFRSFLRHSPQSLAKEIIKILNAAN